MFLLYKTLHVNCKACTKQGEQNHTFVCLFVCLFYINVNVMIIMITMSTIWVIINMRKTHLFSEWSIARSNEVEDNYGHWFVSSEHTT